MAEAAMLQEDGPVFGNAGLPGALSEERAEVQRSRASTVISSELQDSARGRPCASPFLHFLSHVTME